MIWRAENASSCDGKNTFLSLTIVSEQSRVRVLRVSTTSVSTRFAARSVVSISTVGVKSESYVKNVEEVELLAS